MITVSEVFMGRLANGEFIIPVVTVLLRNGTTLSPELKDIAMGCSVMDGAGISSFPVGEAVERGIRLEFINDNGQYDDYSFEGAAVSLSMKHISDTQGTDAVALGTFTVSGPESYGETITVDAADAMRFANTEYSTSLTFPKTAGQVLADACQTLGITLVTTTFANSTFPIQKNPQDGRRTFRQVIGWVAMLAGGNARINRSGGLEIITYDFTYTSACHDLSSFISLKAGREDITITGVKTRGPGDTVGSYGTSGYVLDLENPLWEGSEQAAATAIGPLLTGGVIRDFEGSHIAYPLAEFMDKAVLKDRRGNEVKTVLTDIDFAFGGATTFKNSAESPARAGGVYSYSASSASSETKILIAREAAERQNAVSALSGTPVCVLSAMTPAGVADNYALVGDGLAENDPDSRICVYEVIPGQVVSIKVSKDTGGVFQWQDARTTPTSGDPATLVGDPVTAAFDGLVAAPEGASYLAVSQAKTNTENYIGKPAKGTLA